jgi:hypothetical protein
MGPGQQNLVQAVKRKYAPLAEYLGAHTSDKVESSFCKIEEIMGTALPRMASNMD